MKGAEELGIRIGGGGREDRRQSGREFGGVAVAGEGDPLVGVADEMAHDKNKVGGGMGEWVHEAHAALGNSCVGNKKRLLNDVGVFWCVGGKKLFDHLISVV